MIVFYGRSGLIIRKFSGILMPIADPFLSIESWVHETDGSKDEQKDRQYTSISTERTLSKRENDGVEY